jgi:hypothetical protein
MDSDSLGFRFSLSSATDASMEDGEDALIHYLTVRNLENHARLIKLSMATYVSKDGEQTRQDVWLTGYMAGSERIQGKAHRKAGLVFYKEYLPVESCGDYMLIDATLPDRKKTVTLRFDLVKDRTTKSLDWQLSEAVEQSGDEVGAGAGGTTVDMMHVVERLEAFEERFGVRLEALSATMENGTRVQVKGEMHPRDGTIIEESLYVCFDTYDKRGALLGHSRKFFVADDFFGYAVFDFWDDFPAGAVCRIRVYPTRSP